MVGVGRMDVEKTRFPLKPVSEYAHAGDFKRNQDNPLAGDLFVLPRIVIRPGMDLSLIKC